MIPTLFFLFFLLNMESTSTQRKINVLGHNPFDKQSWWNNIQSPYKLLWRSGKKIFPYIDYNTFPISQKSLTNKKDI